MKIVTYVLGSLMAGLLVTMITAVVTLLSLMATTSDNGERSEGFFGAVFFQSSPVDATTFTMDIGVANPLPLLICTVLVAVVVMFAIGIHRRLSAYRQQLIEA